METLLIASAALPLLVRVTVEAREVAPTFPLAKVSEVPLRLAVAPKPVPVKAKVWVLLATAPLLSAIVRVAVRALIAAGVKVTFRVQLPPAATELPQLLVWAKSEP